MAQRSNPALSKPELGRSLLRLPYYVGRGRSAFHQGQELRAPTKAVYIGADQIVVTLIFRLRHGGGPYNSEWPTIRELGDSVLQQASNASRLDQDKGTTTRS